MLIEGCSKHEVRIGDQMVMDGKLYKAVKEERVACCKGCAFDSEDESCKFVEEGGYCSFTNEAIFKEVESLDDLNLWQEPHIVKEKDTEGHYDKGSLKGIDIIKDKLTAEEFEGFLKGNIMKYTMRMNHKGQKEKDVYKILDYAHYLAKGEWYNV